jgi:hypothetical protein
MDPQTRIFRAVDARLRVAIGAAVHGMDGSTRASTLEEIADLPAHKLPFPQAANIFVRCDLERPGQPLGHIGAVTGWIFLEERPMKFGELRACNRRKHSVNRCPFGKGRVSTVAPDAAARGAFP